MPTPDPTRGTRSDALATLAALEVLDTASPLLRGVCTCLRALGLAAAREQVTVPEVAVACDLLAAELAAVQAVLARWAETHPCSCPATAEDSPMDRPLTRGEAP